MIRPLDWDLSTADVLRLVRDDPHPVALMGAWAGGSDIVTSCPVRVRELPERDPVEPAGACRFGGGWIGYLGYGAAPRFLPVPPPPGEPRRLPDSWFGYYDHVLRRDRQTGQWTFEALDAAAGQARLEDLLHRARTPARPYVCGEFLLTPSPAEHEAAVATAIGYIRRGDLFQANICLRLEADFTGDPLDAFCRAATELDPPYAAFLRLPDGALASLSPELFLSHHGPGVISQPIKGTARRGKDELAEREALERSVKDKAENVMIVDLMRNDLSRVCVPGSVQVPALLRAQAHPGVWHLVSDVRGTLSPGMDDLDLLRATFPPGSVTGAPKVRALEVIHELEATPREVYTGAIGYRSPVAGLELNVAIRTFEFRDGRVWLGSGGGITAGSDPAAEFRECLVKASPLISALGGSFSGGCLPAPSRPRPALGVFTSLRVTDGRCADLAAHLSRLSASCSELYGKGLPVELDSLLAACLADRPTGRLRISVKPLGGPLAATVSVVPVGDAPASLSLRVITLAGGLGAHKWKDRRCLDPGELLIVDSSGDVLETDRANVFAVIDGVLHTPVADGRLLPGITRAAVLRIAARLGIPVAEGRVRLDELLTASEVFATNSVHGTMPVRSVPGLGGWSSGPVAARLRAALVARPVRSAPAPRPRPPRVVARRRPEILLVDNYDSFTYNLAHLLLETGCRVEVISNDELTAADVAAYGPAGIVISPGPGTPREAGISVSVVRACGPVTPLLGICLGHQAIAAAYGADVTTAPLPVHGQASSITHDGRGLLAGLPRPFPAARYHSLIVKEDTLPSCLVVTARGPGRIPMGLRHASHPVEGIQFHPESILTADGAAIISNFVRRTRRP